MKRFLQLMSLLLAFLLLSGTALAHEEGDWIWIDDWDLHPHSDGTACVSGHSVLYANVVVPEEIGGYRIVSVCVDGLAGNVWDDGSSMERPSITLPNTVTTLYDSALRCNERITDFTIPSSVTTIGNRVLSSCYSLQVITIPASVTSIGSDLAADSPYAAFIAPSGSYAAGYLEASGAVLLSDPNDYVLTYVVHGDGTAAITGLKGRIPQTLTIPATIDGYPVSVIADKAFKYAPTLQTVQLPEGVTAIGNEAFARCPALTTVYLPESLTSIGDDAFYRSPLASLTIPAAVVSIGQYALNDVGGVIVTPGSYGETYAQENDLFIITGSQTYQLITETLEDGTLAITEFRGTLPDTLEIPASIDGVTVTRLGIDYSIFTNHSPRKIILPETITAITSLHYCSRLEEINLPDSLTFLDTDAFADTAITSITIPAGITEIPSGCFESCASLSSVTLHSGIREIGNRAFENCPNLTNLTLTGDVIIREDVFNFCPNLTLTVTDGSIPEMYARLAGLPYRVTGSASVVRIPAGTQVIKADAFRGDTSITRVILPGSVHTIESGAFAGCSNLQALNLPKRLTSLASDAFTGCSNMTLVYPLELDNEIQNMLVDLGVGDTMLVDNDGLHDG